ncbi:MAG: hypothetical protein LKE61_03385 [Erysipelotrichaceae bacterium]|jgi:uncharacterized surface anchored protein|nr:hypothetical protein [Erysipelotrichaceae bacterium]MCH4045108.1 hypothetical protein [Erysipelotrichaceae bacterium]MCH4122319.1 hypothetical protein [Erysipelotrichaceae bacterium]MCI1363291.1 hypothetical protein [Solobacterium sp.]MCI1462194.1 hypothetical protein [Solobacterium sp.]
MKIPKTLRKLTAFLLAVGTMAGSIQMPVIAEDSSNSVIGKEIPDNAVAVNVTGEGSVVVEQNGKETSVTGFTLFTGNEGEEITIKASENDSGQKMTAMAVFMEDGTSFNANENHDSSAEYTAKIGTDRYINVLFERRQLVRRMAASYTPSDAAIPSSGSGTLWATASSMYGNQFTLQWISAPLDRFADTIKQYLGECTHHGWLAWTDGNAYGVRSLNYTYSFVGDDTTKYLTITVADDNTHTGTNSGQTVGYQGIQWTNIPITIVIPTKTIHVDVNKVNGNPAITENNECYSLGGAVYGIWLDSALTNKIGEVTTDTSGKASIDISNIDNGVNTVYVKEITPSKGFYIDETKYTVNLNNNSGSVTSTEKPGNDPLTISLTKISDDGNFVTKPKGLENAKFTVKYYAVDPDTYTTVDSVSGLTPTRTWVLKTRPIGDKYGALLNDYYKDSGDAFYTSNAGSPVLPVGVVTVEETDAPEGYTLKNAIINEVSGSTVTQTNGVAYFAVKDNGNGLFQVQGGNEYTVSEKSVRTGHIEIQKALADSGTALQGDIPNLTTTLKITNNNSYGAVLKDGDTVLATADANSDFVKTDGSLYTITTDAKGYWKSPEGYMPYGTYTFTETAGPTGTDLNGKTSTTVTVDSEGQNIKLTNSEIENTAIRGTFSMKKNDLDLGTNIAQGDTNLSAKYALINRSANTVYVDTNEDGKIDTTKEAFAPGETIYNRDAENGSEPYSFETAADGTYTWDYGTVGSANHLHGLPYGTYEVKEVEAPDNYTTDGNTSITFSIRTEDETISRTTDHTPGTASKNLISNRPAYGQIEIYKHVNQKAGSEVDDKPENGAQFLAVLTSKLNSLYGGDMQKAWDALNDKNGQNIDANGNVVAAGKDVVLSSHEFAVITTGTEVNEDGEKLDGYGITGQLAAGNYTIMQFVSGTADGFTADDLKMSDEAKTVDVKANKTTDANGYSKWTDKKSPVKLSVSNDQKIYNARILKKDARTGKLVTLNSASFKLVVDANNNGVLDADDYKYNSVSSDGDIDPTYYQDGKVKIVNGYVTMTSGGSDYNTFRTYTDNTGKVPAGTFVVDQVTTDGKTVANDKGTAPLPVQLTKGTYFILESETPAGYLNYADTGLKFTVDGSCYKDVTSSTEENVHENILTKIYSWWDHATSWISGTKRMQLDDDYFVTETIANNRATGKLTISKTIEAKPEGVDYTYINRDDLSGIQFTLYAAEDIKDPADGSVITKKGDVAKVLTSGSTADSFGVYTDTYTEGGRFYVNKDGSFTLKDIPLGKYTLKETAVPDGIVLSDQTWDVTLEQPKDDRKTAEFTAHYDIENYTTKTKFSKTDVSGEELPGATITILDSKGNHVKKADGTDLTWVSTDKPYYVEGLADGDYVMHETVAPEGYVLRTTDIPFTVKNDKAVQIVSMADKTYDLTKVDAGGEEVEGAKITVTDNADGKVVDTWTSDKTTHHINGLTEGHTYTLHEETAPNGYVYFTDVQITVNSDYTKNQSQTLTDKRVLLTKQDTTGETVEGAELSVYDKDGNLVDQWTTVKGEGHYINGLHAGQSYTLKETKVPDGYVKAADITINVADDGKDQSVVFINKQVTVSKVDAGGEEVIGADMTVVDENGNVVDQWTSDGTDHKVNGLEEGKSYTIHEVTAPNGYVAATDIPFTVSGADENGKKEDQEYTVTDKRVQMLKVDMCGTDVDGAQLSVFAKDGSMVDQWTTQAGDHHYVSGLRAGQTYTVKETIVPEGFVKAADYTFTVVDDGKDQTETIVDMQVEISKEDAGGKEVEGAKLTITDKTTGQAVDQWTSGKETHYASGLEVGRTYTLTEDTAPLGYVKATSIDFTVNDDGVDQKVTMVDTIERLAKVDDKGNVLKGATLEARDEDGNVIDTWESGKHIVDLTEEQAADLEKGKNVEFELEDGSKVTVYALVKTTIETEDDSKDSDLTADEIKEQACNAKELRKAGKTEETPAPDKDAEYTYQAVIVRSDGTYEYRDIDLNGDETTHMVQNLEADRKYTVVETTAPDGYYWTADGDVNATGTEDHVTTMTDNSINYQIAKVDDNGDYVKGVTLQLTDVTDKDNPVAVELPNNGVTTNEPFLLENKLIADHKYELVESEYVAGLYQATSMTFTVPHSGTSEVTTITMKDVLTNVAVTKVDNYGKPVSGAKMSVLKAEKDEDGNIVPVTDEDGNVESVYDFTSTDDYTDISEYVKGSNDVSGDIWYILREDEAPFGFEKTEDIPFTVNGTNDQHQVIMATDVRKTYAVSAVKVDANDEDKHLKGAEITLFDAEGNIVKDINGKECVGVTDGTGVITWQIEYNGDGTVDTGYYVKETAAPKGYRINKNNFTVMLSEDYDFAKDNPVIITVSDTLLPARGVQTGYGSSIFPYEIAGMIAGLAAITCLVLRDEKKRLRNKKD